MNRILRVFLDTDLICNHTGLSKIASKKSINLDGLKSTEHVLFVNSKKNRVKIYSHEGVLIYLVLKDGEQLDMRTLSLIPQAFSKSGRFDYTKALKKIIGRELKEVS